MLHSHSKSNQARMAGAAMLFAASVLAATFSTQAAQAAEDWVLASVEGVVKIDGEAAGSSTRTIGQGAVIETGENGKAVLTRPGDSVTIFPNSRISVPAVGNGGEPGILQTLGRLLFRMESRESRDFEVKTPYLAAAIKGTTFTVEVDYDKAVVEVSEGKVLVTANLSGRFAFIERGERASVGRNNADSVKTAAIQDDGNGKGQKSGTTTLTDTETEEAGTKTQTGSGSNSNPGKQSGKKDSPSDSDSGKGNDPGNKLGNK